MSKCASHCGQELGFLRKQHVPGLHWRHRNDAKTRRQPAPGEPTMEITAPATTRTVPVIPALTRSAHTSPS